MDARWPIAVDRRYQNYLGEIHRPIDPEELRLESGLLTVERAGFRMEAAGGLHRTVEEWRSALSPFCSPLGIRTLYLLYQIANDEPYWRNPDIQIGADELLDRLGFRRDLRRAHYSNNRERVTGVLAAAHWVRLRFPTGEPSALLHVKGWEELEEWPRRLPSTLALTLLYYSGVRRDRDRRGRNYVLIPRRSYLDLSENLSPTAERLLAYLLARHHQLRGRTDTLKLSRLIALERCGIRSQNCTWATRTLRDALEDLVRAEVLGGYSPIPVGDGELFELIWGPAVRRLPSHRARCLSPADPAAPRFP